MANHLIDLTGRQFDRLTVLRRSEGHTGRPHWVCQCSCGAIRKVAGANLVKAKEPTRSCGCWTADRARAQLKALVRIQHGHALRDRVSPEYTAWANAKKRCFDPKCSNYANYGGRGISMCPEWSDSFEAFLRDVGPRPSPEHSLDRENNEFDYQPGNVRWATDKQQRENRRKSHFVTIAGQRLLLADAARIHAVPYKTLFNYFRRDCSPFSLRGLTFEIVA